MGDRGQVVQRTLAVSSALAGLLLLTVTIWWQPAPTSPWQSALHQLADTLWPLALIAAAAILAYQRSLRPRIAREFERLSEQATAGASPPREVMTTLLSRIYGETHSTDDVIVGVLGGAGLEPRGSDLTISTNTTVLYRLERVDPKTYELRSTVTYSFKENVTDHRFAIFATCDPALRDSIALACRLPLYESWFVSKPELFEKSVDRIASSAHIGINYTDLEGRHHRVEPTKVDLVDALYGEWPEYLTIFRESMGSIPKQSPLRYVRTLRIFKFDLGELADADHAVGAIRSLSLTSTSLHPIDDPFCFWQAPYPCYVDRVGFDPVGLELDGDEALLFRVVPFAFRSAIAPSGEWVPAAQLDDLYVRSWLLPGHGVALMWKPSRDETSSHPIGEL